MLPCRYFCRYFRYLLKYFFLKCGDKLEQAEVTLKEIYEKVSLKVPLEQRRFFNFFNDTVAELESIISRLTIQRRCAFYTGTRFIGRKRRITALYSGNRGQYLIPLRLRPTRYIQTRIYTKIKKCLCALLEKSRT